MPVRYTVPPMLRDRPLALLIEGVEAGIRERQRALCEAHAASGRGFRGVKAVLNGHRSVRDRAECVTRGRVGL